MPDATPLSHWIGFHIFVFALMTVEFLYVRWRRSKDPSEKAVHSTSVAATILWVGAALIFAFFILRVLGGESATQYLAGYAIEEALSIDNLFVFLLLFRFFRIEATKQPKVLFWGVVGAILMRGGFIAAGIGLLDHFEWVSYIFAVVLLIASIRLVLPEDEKKKEGDTAMADVDLTAETSEPATGSLLGKGRGQGHGQRCFCSLCWRLKSPIWCSRSTPSLPFFRSHAILFWLTRRTSWL